MPALRQFRSRLLWRAAALLGTGCPAVKPSGVTGPSAPIAGAPWSPDGPVVKGLRADGQTGDHVLSNGNVVAVISASEAPDGHHRRVGALIDLGVAGLAKEALQALQPAVIVGDEVFTAVVTEITRDARGVVTQGKVKGHDDLVLETVYAVGAADRHLSIHSRVQNHGSSTVALHPSDTVYLGNTELFAPGHGPMADSAEPSLPFFAHQLDGWAFAYEPQVDIPLPVRFSVFHIGDAKFGGSAKPVYPLVELRPGDTASWRRHVAVGEGDLSAATDALAAAHMGGTVYEGRILGPANVPMPDGTVVLVRNAEGRPHTRVRPSADGSFRVTLRGAGFSVVALAPGAPGSPPVDLDPARAAVGELRLPASGALKYAVRDERGEPLPARLVVVGLEDTPEPSFGPMHRADGARNTIYSHSGAGVRPVAPGRYNIVATRGMEYDLDAAEVEIEPGRTTEISLTLRRVLETPKAVAGDFHLHAEGSGDSDASFASRVQSLVAEGLEVAAATDHNRISDYQPAIDALGVARWIQVGSGAEMSTGRPSWGHFNAFPLAADPSAPGRGTPRYIGTTPKALFAAARTHPGQQVVQVNHPRMPPRIGYFELAELNTQTAKAKAADWDASFDAIEVFNGIWLNKPEQVLRNLDDWFGLLQAGHRHAAMGNSDSHRLVEQEVGYPRTYVGVPDDDPSRVTFEQVVDGIRNGRTQVSSGPYLSVTVDGKGPGETVHVGGRATLPAEIWVHAAPWVPVDQLEVIAGGEVVWSVAIPPAASVMRMHGRFDLDAREAGWVVVVVRGDGYDTPVVPLPGAVAWAFTSPVFLDRQIDASVDSPPR